MSSGRRSAASRSGLSLRGCGTDHSAAATADRTAVADAPDADGAESVHASATVLPHLQSTRATAALAATTPSSSSDWLPFFVRLQPC